MKRRLVALIVGVSALAAPVAIAHPAKRFDACVRARVAGERCANSAEAGRGTPLAFKAVVRPNHNSEDARMWRLRPHTDWEKVGRVDIQDGRMSWGWVPREGDTYNFTAWRFRFVIPGHGHSDTVKVHVRSDEF